MRIRLTLAAPLLLIALTWLLLCVMNPDAELFDGALAALDRFGAGENALRRDVLRARAGMLRNYDPLVLETNALDEAINQLMQVATTDPETATAIERLSSALSRQEDLVEKFKSENALLQNSLAYFRLFSSRVMTSGQDGPVVRSTGALASAMLNLSLDTSPAATREVADYLDKLAAETSSFGDGDTANGLLAHGRLLRDVLPGTDNVLKTLLEVPSTRELEGVRSKILTLQSASRERARQFWIVLYGTSLLLLGMLVHLGFQLRARASTLRRRAAFEHLIAAISARFVNAPSIEIDALVEQALCDLARHMGADRGYFVLETGPEEVRIWRQGDGPWPPGWPHPVLELTAHFKGNAAGIIHIGRLDQLPPGAGPGLLGGAGVQDWVCVPPAPEDIVRCVLGFDAVRSSLDVSTGDLGLLRMACNTINGAIRRNSIERARRRLEKRLQHARRMETVGALASGIAHNFNNIIGAIVGHVELVEARIALHDSRAACSLDAIRRASERGRDLADQILVFGRRQEGRQRPVNVLGLIAEAESLLRASLPGTIDLVIASVQEPIIVSGEPAQLQQVIINLCNNAAQAMNNSGQVKLSTDIHDVAPGLSLSHGELAPGRYVRLAVSDAGRGIDAAMLGRIFEPFFTTRMDGNGLGLATVRDIVEDHGGAMNVRSTPGAGSRFEVWLPCVPAAVALGIYGQGIPIGHGETLLVVDYDCERLLRAEEILAALGYEPVGFANVIDALAACKSRPERFDAVVVSLGNQAAVTLEFATTLHAIAPKLPIVLAARSTDGIGAGKLAAAGVFEMIHCSLNSAEVAASLRRCLMIEAPIWSRSAAALTPFSSIETTPQWPRTPPFSPTDEEE